MSKFTAVNNCVCLSIFEAAQSPVMQNFMKTRCFKSARCFLWLDGRDARDPRRG